MGAFLAKRNGVFGLVIGIAVVIGLWLAWAYWGVGLMHRVALAGTGLTGTASGAESYATAGQIGDLFGGVNALFAALACVGVFWAGWLQRLQLEDARKAYAAERMSSELKEDEAFFFQLLSIVKSVTEGLVFKSPPGYAVPQNVEAMVDYMLTLFFINRCERGEYATQKEQFDALIGSMNPVFVENFSAMAVYFRTVFQLFIWLNEHDAISAQKRAAYVDIARSHITSGFATLLGIFSLQDEGAYFRSAIERYGLLEHIMGGDHSRQALRFFYSPAAFGQKG